MASPARILANVANAQLSTGPRTEEGKARSARNATTHGFSTGVLAVAPAGRAEFDAFDAALVAEVKPVGALEMDALREFRDAAWRLRQIRGIMKSLFDEHGADPLANPETAAAVRQLTRYRAAAEMSLHRALNALRDLQTIRFGREVHLAKSEYEAIGPLAAPKSFAVMTIEGRPHNRFARDCFDSAHNITFIL